MTNAVNASNLNTNKVLSDKITDIETAAKEDLANGDDAARFENPTAPQGWRGSLALSGAATSGNTNDRDLSIAGRLTYGTGLWNHTMGVAGEFGKTGGVESKKKIYGVYEANRYFNDTFYMFATARYQYDAFGSNTRDGFIGFGPGVRMLNSEKMTWRVQAGPGVRFVETNTGESYNESSMLASSRFYYKLSDVMSLTNDTDILKSGTSTLSSNDFGINYKLSQTLTTRVSYKTEYNSQPAAGFKKNDNTLGVSLVIGF